MNKQTSSQVDGYILELYRHGLDLPCYVSAFDHKAEAGFDGYSESKEDAVVFESREALASVDFNRSRGNYGRRRRGVLGVRWV